MSDGNEQLAGNAGNEPHGNSEQAGNTDTTNNGGGYQPGPGEYIVDPASIGNASSGGGDNGGGATEQPSTRRRRGRPPGSGKKSAAPQTDIKGLTAILLSSHEMLAALTRVPELQLSDEEAAKLGEGAANVMRHYDVGPQTQKAVDWTNLFMVLGMIYGTRFVAVKHRRASEKSAAPDNVIHLHGQPTG